MENEKKPIVWMILFGVTRHVLGIIGTWLVARGLIDADTHQRLVSEGATQVVGWLLMSLPIVWSVLQKYQVVGWLKTAFHLDSRVSTLAEIPAKSAGPGMAI